MSGFFQSLEYGRPVLGVKIPFSWIDSSWKEGTIEIAEATLEPGGPGMWKLAVQPRLLLKGVSVNGPKEGAGRALQAISPKGINTLKIIQFEFRGADASETIHLQEVVIKSRKVSITAQKGEKGKIIIIHQIFGKSIDVFWL